MNNDTILFSIICPVYNSEKTLRFSVDSVLRQSYKKFELIIIDDGSEDMSGTICDELARSDDRIKVIHKINEGQSKARLLGIKESKGDYILFLDSDDCYLPNALEELNLLLCNKRVDAVLYNAYKKQNDNISTVYSLEKKMEIVDKAEIVCECFLKRIAGYLWTYCFKKELFCLMRETEEEFSRIRYSEDVYLIYNLIKQRAKSLITIPPALYEYIDRTDSITHCQSLDKVKERFAVFDYVYSNIYLTFGKTPFKAVKELVGWMYISCLIRSANELTLLGFKKYCRELRKSFIYRKMSDFKKDKLTCCIHLLFKFKLYKITYFAIRKVAKN